MKPEHNCDPDKKEYVYHYEIIGKGSLDYDKHKWYISPDSVDFRTEIVYCPYCGVKLE